MHVTRSKSIVEQVNEILRERIRTALYEPGSRLPSENELAEEFGVSRATVRTVLAKLSIEGLILRRQGDGTYVNQRINEVNTHLGGLWDFSRLIQSSGFDVSIQALSLKEVEATKEEAHELAVQPGETLLMMKRLFLADHYPVIVANNRIPKKFLKVPLHKIDGQLHIRDILKRYCEKEIAFAVTEIGAAAGGKSLQLLQRKRALRLSMTFYSKDDEPLAIGSSFFDDQRLHLRLVQAWN